MSEIINCFLHCIEDTGTEYKYSYLVPTHEGLAVRHLTTGHLETQPIFQEVPVGRDLAPQFENMKRFFKQNLSTDIIKTNE